MDKRQEWEYLFVTVMPNGTEVAGVWSSGGERQAYADHMPRPSLADYFGILGEAGWELTVYVPTSRQFIFKRPG